jgi:spermidine/putrescine transport system ATP-binding protein
VGKRFGDVVAVDRASFAIGRGELFSLLGPSGCGKTTLLRLIAGFEQPTTGTIRLDGLDVTAVPAHRRNVHTVFQQYALFPHLSVYENVAFGPRTRGLGGREIDRRVRAILEVVRLGGLAERHPRQLSGGQQQRVALARALVNRPSAVLLDEPLAALDPELRRGMQVELARIQRDADVAFLLVTHDREEALALSDRIAVMSVGRIEQVGAPESVYDTPASPFVAGFIGAANLLEGTVESADGAHVLLRLSDGSSVEVARDGRETSGQVAGTALVRGAAATILVRPERVRLARSAPADAGAAIAVTVRSVLFQGPILRYAAVDARGTEIVAHVPADTSDPRLRCGERGWAAWDRGAARLLAGSPNPPAPCDGTAPPCASG